MSLNFSIWDRLSRLAFRLLVLLFLCAGSLIIFYWYLPLIQKNQRYRRELLELDGRIAEEERSNRQLKSTLDSVQNDPRTLERLAREKLGYARSNEFVVRFDPSVRYPARTSTHP